MLPHDFDQYRKRLGTFFRENSLLKNKPDKQIAFLGDTLVERFDLENHFPGESVFNRGISNDRLDHESGYAALHRLTPELLIPNPTAIVILLGACDVADGAGAAATAVRTAAVLDKLRRAWPDVDLVLHSVPPVRNGYRHLTSHIQSLNSKLASMAATHDVRFFDLHRLLAGRSGLLRRRYSSRDGYHLTALAYNVWSRHLSRQLGIESGTASLASSMSREAQCREAQVTTATPALDILPNPETELKRHRELPVHRMVARQAECTPDATALYDTVGHCLTYRQVVQSGRAIASELTRSGISKGDVVAIWAARTIALPQAILGTWMAGGAFTILDPAYPTERQKAALEIAEPRAVLLAEGAGPIPEELEDALASMSCLSRLPVSAVPSSMPEATDLFETDSEVDAADIAYIAFTSGTTGKPKGIVATHAPLSHFFKWYNRTFDIEKEARFAMLSGLAHDPLLRDIFAPLTRGACLVAPSKETLLSPPSLRALLAEEQVTAVHITPSLAMLISHGFEHDVAYRSLPALKWVFFGGEKLKESTLTRFRCLTGEAAFVNFYGATETPQAMSYWAIPMNRSTRVEEGSDMRVGRGIADTQVLVLDKQGRRADVGMTGEICIRTPYLALEYLEDDTLTKARFTPNPYTDDPTDRIYRTGDVGCYAADGSVEIQGRGDRQIKVRGFRVELDDVETTLTRLPGVQQAAVTAIADTDGFGMSIAAYAVVERGVEAKTIRDRATDRLPSYMVPAHIVLLDAFPLTANGKIDRRALPPITDGRGAEDTPHSVQSDGKKDDIIHRLARIWQDVLHVSEIHPDDSFFDLGGDSLRGLELLLRVEQEFHRKLPVNALLLSSSVSKMAKLLKEDAARPHTSLLVPIREGSIYPPLYWLPGGGGLSVMAFRDISFRLGPDLSVFGLEADLDIEHAPTALPDIVRAYCREIRHYQPHGPYYLMGFSLGSFVAYELALQLHAAGEEVGMLVVFDTEVPSAVTRRERLLTTLQRSRYRMKSILNRDGWLSAVILDNAKNLKNSVTSLFSKNSVPEEPTVFDIIVDRNIRAVAEYAAKPLPYYNGKVTCVLARNTSMHGVSSDIDPRLSWRKTCREIDVHYANGNHLSMLRPPAVDTLAAVLRTCIRNAFAARILQ